jgi:two-component system, NarL family, sensor histidine kinase EvgS
MTPSRFCNEPTPSALSTPGTWSPPPSLVEVASGDETLIAELIGAFHTDTDNRMRQIHAALAVTELSRISEEAHSIKGGARQLGADELADACQDLEILSNARESPAVVAGLKRVQQVYNETRRAMAVYCANHRSNSAATSSR